MITLGDVRTVLAPFVGNGVPCTSDKIGPAVKLALERLAAKAGANSTFARMLLCPDACGRITLPRYAQYIIKARPCAGVRPFDLNSQYYKFLSNGPGGLAMCNPMSLQDLGAHHATFQEFPDSPLRILPICEQSGDEDVTVHIRGIDPYGREYVNDEGEPGETIRLHWGQTPETAPEYSKAFFKEITAITKPVTKGYVHIFAYQPQGMKYVKLASLHPRDTASGYKRYQLPHARLGQMIEALVKLKSLDLDYDHDPIIIDNVGAIKAMLQSMHAADTGNTELANFHQDVAIELLSDQLREYDSMMPEFDFDRELYGAGSIPTII